MSNQPAVVERARACIGCGYNLAGLPLAGACPECGTSVDRSMREPVLAHASPEYLRQLERGAIWLVVAAIATVVSLFLIPATIAWIDKSTPGAARSVPVVIYGLSLLPAIVSAWASWQFTTPDPQYSLESQPVNPRKWVRASVVTMLAADVCKLVMAIAGINANFTPAIIQSGQITRPALALLVILTSWAAWLTHFFAMMLYARWLARRVPDMAMDRRARRYTWILPLWATVGILACGLGPFIAAYLYSRFFWRLREIIAAERLRGQSA